MKFFKRPEWCRPQWAVALLIAASSVLPAHAAVQPLDHIVAIVNDEVITRQELAKRYTEVSQSLARQKTPLPPREVLEKQLLERMVTELALQQHARSTGIRVDPAQVERALQRIAAQNKLDMAGLAAALERDGQSLDSMRNTIRNEILIARARERDVDNRISVSDSEIEGYLQTQAQQGMETEYNFAHILITVPENASPELIQARRARAEDILAQLGIDTEKAYGYKVIEPLIQLRKPGVRAVGKALGMPEKMYSRPPFPGPALVARVIGEATRERIALVRKATGVVERELAGIKAFQYMAILHEDRVTGMRAGKRDYGFQIEIRCWDSKDAVTASPTKLPFDLLRKLAARITSEVPGVVSVTYNITTKPPSTIEAV